MEDLAAWRKAKRAELIARRQALDPAERRAWSAALERNLRQVLAERGPATLGFYWPFRGEFDPRLLVRDLVERDWRAALPVVTRKNQPMEFRLWTPGAVMVNGIWDIPAPRDGAVVVPDIVLAPLVGFDEGCFRLGYGGGYFDRTLAILKPRPCAIGVGFEFQKLDSIAPQPFDQRLDIIVTEAAIRR